MSHQRIPCKKIAEFQNDEKICLDLSFQSEERWSDTQRRKYINSLLSDSCPTPIVLAVVKDCLEYCKKQFGDDSPDYLYFKDKEDRGYEYISIDGNNRSRALKRFVNGEFGLTTTKDLKIKNIEQEAYKIWKPTKSSRFYHSLPQFIKSHFDQNVHVIVYKVTEASLDDLCDLFLCINDGVTLNPQEKRNAIVCQLANIVRELSEDFDDFFSQYWTKDSRNRRNHQEFIVSLFVHVTRLTSGNINKQERDSAYDDESKELTNVRKVREILRIASECCTNYDKSGKLLPNEATRIDFSMIIYYLLSNDYKISNKRKFFEWFVESYNQAKTAKDDNGNNIILWTNKSGLDARDYAGVQRSFDGGHRYARLEVYVKALSELDDDVIVQKDPKRAFESLIRPQLWIKQEKKCAISGKLIPLESVMDGNITHVDHVIPHGKGGRTEIENATLVFKDENLNKSDVVPVGSL